MSFVVKCWIEIPIEDMEDLEKYDTREEAEKELEQSELLQPNNKYEVVEI